MSPELLVAPERFASVSPLLGREEIRRHNAQRFEMEMLDGVLLHDPEEKIIVGYYDVRADAWWARGHFPDRPLLPGVLALEAAGQLCSVYFHRSHPGTRMGLAGIDSVRFRKPIEPPCTLYLVARMAFTRARFAKFEMQGIIDGQLVFESVFTGAAI